MMMRDWRKLILYLCLPVLFVIAGYLLVLEVPRGRIMVQTPPIAYGTAQFKGISIGNALDAPKPEEWGVVIKPDYFLSIKQAGFNTVRIPVRFSAHTSLKPPYKIDADFNEIVKGTIDAGLEAGLIVILDMHHFDEIMEDPANYEEMILSLWGQISRTYKRYPANLYYEILNEPSDALTAERWNSLADKIIAVIRENDPDRKIVVDTADYSNIHKLKALMLPDDKNLIAAFHFYEPFEFTHQGAGWVEGSNIWMGRGWQGNEEEKGLISRQLDEAAKWSSEMEIPVMMGEFGAIEQADRGSRLRWTAFLARETEKRNISWIYWQLCSNFAAYSCINNNWDKDLLGALIPINASN